MQWQIITSGVGGGGGVNVMADYNQWGGWGGGGECNGRL